ncbi:MAG: GDYXXLXY domain-containing protein, partial [Phenylobacterium sp.]|uniref:GDYXXLXY domain-containing protein n=1 Tax=Phenylobacterium sp. TaxID=1871053 RepID=UPI001A58EA15
MRAGAPVRILAAAGVLALALVGLVARETIAREQGTEVRLALAGYDPRSLLQGHYVRFNLTHRFPPGSKCPPGSAPEAGPAEDWVALRREGDHHAPAGAAKTRAEALKLGEVAVRGRIDCFADSVTEVSRILRPGEAPVPDGPAAPPEPLMVGLDLGVDRIHLEQEEAEAIEAELLRARPEGGPPGYAVLSIG